MKSSFCIDLQRFMLIPTKFPLSHKISSPRAISQKVRSFDAVCLANPIAGLQNGY